MDQNTVVLKKFLSAEMNRDIESMASCLHQDFFLHVVGADERVHGKTNFLKVIKKVLNELKDWNLGVTRMIGNGDCIAVEFDGSGRFTGEFEGKQYSNVPITSRSISVFDFEDGLIKKCAEYYDHQAFRQQIIRGSH